jgi:penicillin-insensitive murein DD-endopeptidase
LATLRGASHFCFALSLLAANFAAAQDKGSVNPEPLPPLAHPNDPATPAKELFGRKTTPALATRTIGFYSKGCIAGAKALHFSHQVGLDADIWLTPMPD